MASVTHRLGWLALSAGLLVAPARAEIVWVDQVVGGSRQTGSSTNGAGSDVRTAGLADLRRSRAATGTDNIDRFLVPAGGTASVVQSGQGNWIIGRTDGGGDVAISQTGLQNGIGLTQSGTGNSITAIQVGTQNEMTLAQAGDRLSMTASQTGTMNTMTLQQAGALSSIVAVQSGTANTLGAAQTGSGNRLVAYQR